MFLTDLQEKLRDEQTKYGNVKLGHAQIGHARGAIVDYYGEDGDQPPDPQLTTIAEAEGVTGTLEERLAAAGITGIVSLTGAELQQLLEYRAELMASYDTRPSGEDPPKPPILAGEAGGPGRPQLVRPPMALNFVPAAMFIESAKDSLKDADIAMLKDQRKELEVATGETNLNYQEGYELGLQTARICLMLDPAMQLEAQPTNAVDAMKAHEENQAALAAAAEKQTIGAEDVGKLEL